MNKKFFSIAFLIVLLDQVTKFVFTNVNYGIFRYTENTGAAFSLFQGYVNWLIIFSSIVVVVILAYYKRYPKYWLSLSFVLGGTIGNLIDRIFLGYVRDFIDLRYWPVFNVADSFNVIGVLLLIYMINRK